VSAGDPLKRSSKVLGGTLDLDLFKPGVEPPTSTPPPLDSTWRRPVRFVPKLRLLRAQGVGEADSRLGARVEATDPVCLGMKTALLGRRRNKVRGKIERIRGGGVGGFPKGCDRCASLQEPMPSHVAAAVLRRARRVVMPRAAGLGAGRKEAMGWACPRSEQLERQPEFS